ncbi:MAG: type I 3-dehydroquinate dehydratase [Thermoplasmata archaeon]|nr:type I 3-dehydroquinate dehydratase [Thermoplasmata archaeon]MCI4359482.1 type I 3-dehydroquinate dehydratase [Thermoplasmata archaeon]
MTARRPWLIATLSARSAPECRSELDEASRGGADLAEVRVDRWPESERPGLSSLFPSPLPLIGTYRSHREGGEGDDDPGTRARILAELGALPFWAIDRERARDWPPAEPERADSILSMHLSEGTPPEAVRGYLLEAEGSPRFVKVVLPATLSAALELLRRAVPTQESGGFLLHTTAGSGPLFRALAWSLGFTAVYGSLPTRAGRETVEPSQIPVNRLRHYLSAPQPGPLFALLGGSVGRSRSPALFSGWMEELGDPGLYVGLDVRSEAELAEALPTLAALGFRGFNITRPWKEAAHRIASRIGPGAGPCGCANVLSVSPGGVLEAENTDLAAILRRLNELVSEGRWDRKELLIVGAGGAARAALAAGRSMQVEMRLLARNRPRAEGLEQEFGARPADSFLPRTAALVVNATSMGTDLTDPPGVYLKPFLDSETYVLDLVYDPVDPWLRAQVEARGGRYEGGLRLLVYQAAESYAIWQGHPVPDEFVERAIEEEL